MQSPAQPADHGLFGRLFEVYLPRQHCMNYEGGLIWLHVVSDLMIAAAYFSIPLALIYFVRRRRDLGFHWIFVLFAAFILACGTTHVFDVVAIWKPIYWLDGLVKLTTGVLSLVTAALLWPMVPRALAVPSPATLQRVNRDLEQEVAERQRVEEEQRRLYGELETRVAARTAELARANRALETEIAARKKAEVERQHLLESERWARGEAERVNRTKDEFVASLSHELRTPLNAILGWAQLLRHKGVSPEVERGLEIIERNAQVQTQLVEDLLDMSRIVSGKIRLDVQDVELARVAEAALETVRPAADGRGVRLAAALGDAGRLRGDPSRLQQVIWNLLSNAVKFTPKEGTVTLAVEREEPYVRVIVRDTGKGIAPEFLPYLFQRFRQGDAAATRKHHGLGLGLSIVKHLVELHGGSVEAESAGEGEGSTFVVQLPVHLEIETEQAPAPDVDADATALKGVRVLVVDDDEDARELMRRLLEERGAVVKVAESAAEGFERLRAWRPDVLLSDIGMPEEDGYTLIRRIRALPPEEGGQIPAAAVTAFARAEDRVRALLTGFQIHLTKPVQPAEMLTVVSGLAGLGREAAGTVAGDGEV